MTVRILACLVLLAFAGSATDFRFYPVNVCHKGEACVEGLTFYFEGQGDSQAIVTVTALQNGKPVTKTQTIDTAHRRDTDPVFHMLIDRESRHDLIELKITMGGRTYSFKRAASGQLYQFGEAL